MRNRARPWSAQHGWRRLCGVLIALTVLAGCAVGPAPTASPTPLATLPASQAIDVVRAYLAAWMSGDYARMYPLLPAEERASVSLAQFSALHESLTSLAGITFMVASVAAPTRTVLTPEISGSPVPGASAAPAGSVGASAAPSTSRSSAGPVTALAFPVHVDLQTTHFGAVTMVRTLELIPGKDAWQVHWTPRLLFADLGSNGSLRLVRTPPPRGRIVAADGTVFAQTRVDGMRVYPQESLAGQTIGYVSRVTAEDLKTLAARGYEAGDWVGRSGLERGAEALLRGSPGFDLFAVRPGAGEVRVLSSAMTPGANLTISLRPSLQRTAEAAGRRYPRVASAAVDPRNGDVLALASGPAFDPNAVTLGATLRGVRLSPPSAEQIINKAVLGAYPAGSDFKPFTLGAALQTGTVSTGTRMLCPGTWVYGGFTFRNFMAHSMPGLHTWPETMAFSCNTTYMPLSILVYGRKPTALTDVIRAFGFGQATGIPYLAENPGVLPDAAYFQRTPRYGTHYAPYNGFDQIQLAIGQGSYLGTPLQLAMAYAAWGNRGTLWQPRLVLKATLPDGTPVFESTPTVHHTIPLSRGVMDYVVSTMRAVVTYSYGTAHRAFVGFPIAVAGKSGTAETGGPDPDAWFPSFAPMSGPTIAVATVVITVPLGTGGDFAAPIVRQIMTTHFYP